MQNKKPFRAEFANARPTLSYPVSFDVDPETGRVWICPVGLTSGKIEEKLVSPGSTVVLYGTVVTLQIQGGCKDYEGSEIEKKIRFQLMTGTLDIVPLGKGEE